MIFKFYVKRIRLICNEATTMYNLFVTSQLGYWERHRSYELELSRTSEFLDPGILYEYQNVWALVSLLLTKRFVIANGFDLEICFGSQALGMVAYILS